MRLNERQINALVGGAVLALLPLAWLQYRWISEVSDADRQRRTTELQAGLERIAADTDRAAGQLHATLIGPAGGDDFPLEDRILGYRPNRDSVPVARIFRVVMGEDGWHTEFWNPEQRRMAAGVTPDWWAGEPFRRGPIHRDPAAFLGPAFAAEAEETGFVVLELDEKKIEAEFLPRLIRRQLGDAYSAQYAIRIAKEGETGPADAVVGIFRQFNRGEPPTISGGIPKRKKKKKQGGPPAPEVAGPGLWKLEARHLDGSLEAAVARTRIRNLIVSAVTLLFLGMALVSVGFALRRSQRLARLQLEFTAGVSHELRTPLAVIVSAGDNLAGGYVKDPERVREYGALVRDEGTRLTGMVDQVLRFSEMEAERMPLERRPVLVTDLLENVEREMRPVAASQNCVWESTVENVMISGDPAALHVALRNLVENGLRHGGGKWIGVSAKRAGANVEIAVEDRGGGISPADMPHLFSPFYRGVESRAQQRKGSGLGLALVDRIARAHGGKIAAANRAGGGARFTLTLPCG